MSERYFTSVQEAINQTIRKDEKNGDPQPIPESPVTDAVLEGAILRLEKELKHQQLKTTKAMLESFWYSDFGGTDEYFRMRFQTSGQAGWLPMALPSDRRGGAKWPLWRTEMELNNLRQESRVLVDSNTYAKGLLKNLTNYVINRGYDYRCHVAARLPDKYGPTDPKEFQPVADKVQRWLADWLQRNRWNVGADPKNGDQAAVATREKEIFRRVYRDGEALVQFFYLPDGDSTTRFIDPECVRQPPGARWEEGWAFGRQHRTKPFTDYEITENWYVLYHDTMVENQEQANGQQGKIIPGDQVVQIKLQDEDAEVARGTPFFSFDTADALRRASRIQRNLSQTAAERAKWAEIWKHVTGTLQQVQTLAQGLSVVNATSGGSGFNQGDRGPNGMGGGGITRRVSSGMEPVNPPSSTGVGEHMEAIKGDLRQACAAVTAPEYMAGSTNDANYATAAEAGVPFVRNGESEQEHFKSAFLVCVWRAIRWAVKCGKLPPEAIEVVDIQCESIQIHKNNEGEITAKSRTQNEAGVLSATTWALRDGLDPDQEDRNFQKEGRKFGQMIQKYGQRGDPASQDPDSRKEDADAHLRDIRPQQIQESQEFLELYKTCVLEGMEGELLVKLRGGASSSTISTLLKTEVTKGWTPKQALLITMSGLST